MKNYDVIYNHTRNCLENDASISELRIAMKDAIVDYMAAQLADLRKAEYKFFRDNFDEYMPSDEYIFTETKEMIDQRLQR